MDCDFHFNIIKFLIEDESSNTCFKINERIQKIRAFSDILGGDFFKLYPFLENIESVSEEYLAMQCVFMPDDRQNFVKMEFIKMKEIIDDLYGSWDKG